MSKNHGRNSSQKRALKRRIFNRRQLAPCCFCRKKMTFARATLEHVIPLSKDGSWNIKNLRVSCSFCNSRRGDQDFTEFRKMVRKIK